MKHAAIRGFVFQPLWFVYKSKFAPCFISNSAIYYCCQWHAASKAVLPVLSWWSIFIPLSNKKLIAIMHLETISYLVNPGLCLFEISTALVRRDKPLNIVTLMLTFFYLTN